MWRESFNEVCLLISVSIIVIDEWILLQVPIHTSGADVEHKTRELHEKIASLTAQYAQLEEANRAWQSYQQTQLDNFKTKLHDHLPIDESSSFDDIAQEIVDQMTKEREEFRERYEELEKMTDSLRSGST